MTQKPASSLTKDFGAMYKRFPLDPRHLVLLVICGLSAGIFEAVGISIFLPILQFARLNGDEAKLQLDGGFWQKTEEIFSSVGLPLEISTMVGVAALAILLRQAFLFWAGYFRTWLRQEVNKKISEYIFEKFLRAKMFRQNSYDTGDLVNSVMAEATKGSTAMLMPLDILVHVVLGLLYMGILALLEWQMTLAAFLIIGLVSVLPKVWVRRSRAIGAEFARNSAKMSTFLVERLRAGRLMKMSCTENLERGKFENITARRKRLAIDKYINLTKTQIVIEPTVICLSLAFILLASTVFKMPIEAIGVYVIIILRLVPLLRTTLGMVQNIQDSSGAFHIVLNKLVEMESDKEETKGAKNLGVVTGEIELRNVSFRYPNQDKFALTGCSLKINAGEFVSLVGSSGAGKSTLVDLIPGLIEPSEGEIFFGRHSLSTISLESLRSQIAFIPQQPALIPGTLYDHLTYGHDDHLPAERLNEVLEMAGVDEFMGTLENGLETVLDGSRQLSGGQMQRLEVARALARNAKILILDEPTSNLDAKAEKIFAETLEKILAAKDKTLVLIAHSLRNVIRSSKIVVLRQGRITDIGQHSELLLNNDWYSNAWYIQQSKIMETATLEG